jgi:hypothetical protein
MRYVNEWRTEAAWVVLLVGLILAGSAAACLLSTDASAGPTGLLPADSPTFPPAGVAAGAAVPAEAPVENLDGAVGLDATGTPMLLP